jgi:predicted RNA-binding Zn-ribbon protein involved in translation (DUF1610 family)
VPIQVVCSSCHSKFNAPDSAAGKKTKCPKCGGVIEIPTPKPAAVDDVLDAEEAPRTPFTDEDFEDPVPTPAVEDDRKPCPMCGEMIQRNAIKCRHCGEIFDPLLKAQQRKSVTTSSYSSADEDLSALEWIVAILCSGIGCILGIIWMIQGKPKGKKMLMVSLIVQGIGVVLQVILASMQQGGR